MLGALPQTAEVPTVPHVYAAIQEVQRRFSQDGLAKSRQNVQQRFSFRGIDDVYNSLSTYLVDAKLLLIPRVVSRETSERTSKGGGTLIYTNVTVEYDLISSIDGSKITACVVGEAMDSGDKSTNKAMSAAYKYLCLQTFCIPTEGDNDADATTHEVKPRDAAPAEPAKRKGPEKPVVRHIKEISLASTMDELKRAFASAWRDYEDPSDPRIVTIEHDKFKAAYEARKLELLAQHGDESVVPDHPVRADDEGYGSA